MTASFGNRLKQLRKEKKWTQKELGERIGVNGRSISDYEAGKNIPSWETLSKLADVFDVPNEFFLLEGENSPADVPVNDQELLRYFMEVDKMDKPARDLFKAVIEAMIIKEKWSGKAQK